jgi:hypothetical protein
VQLLEVFSSAAILAITEPGAGWAVVDGDWAAGDVGRAATAFATGGACLCGLTTGFAACIGAWTVMLGSWSAGRVEVCEAAVPLSNTVDRTATAEGATRLDDTLITRSPKYRPRFGLRYLFRFSAVTRNFPPFSMPVQYHHDRFRSQPVNILVSTH